MSIRSQVLTDRRSQNGTYVFSALLIVRLLWEAFRWVFLEALISIMSRRKRHARGLEKVLPESWTLDPGHPIGRWWRIGARISQASAVCILVVYIFLLFAHIRSRKILILVRFLIPRNIENQ